MSAFLVENLVSFPRCILVFCSKTNLRGKYGITKHILLFLLTEDQLHDLDVNVGDTINDMHLCGHFTGHTNIGGRVAVWCPHNTRGRYVQIQIVAGNLNSLTPAEVLVWGVHVK